jgi:hypothetical protein
MKLDSLGNKQWVRVLGTTGDESGATILSVGVNYYLIGRTVSKDHDCADTVNHPGPGGSTYTIKLDALGNTVWSKAQYGAILNGAMYDARDNSILITGRGSGNRQGVTGYIGMDDMFLMKLDTAGNFKWGRLYGTSANDEARGLCKGVGNNYLLVGMSYHDSVFIDRGTMLNIDGSGNLLDQKIVTGNGGATFLRVFQNHNSYNLFGISYSSKLSEGTGLNCPFNGMGSGAMTLSKVELWKTGIEGPSAAANVFKISPNPTRSHFELKFSEPRASGILTCMDALGALVSRQRVEAGTDRIMVPTISWQRGNYVVCWQPDGGTQTIKSITIY